MSVYTTIEMTRAKAIRMIMTQTIMLAEAVLRKQLESYDNTQLEAVADEILAPDLYHCLIVPDP